MASGLLALLDDVAAIARLAATTLDDVAAATAKAGAKSAGVVIDDAAVTPTYVSGFTPDRELPIIGRIALGSIRNKLLLLLPVFVTLAALWPQGLMPLLMLGGAYLCFEAAEKLLEALGFHHGPDAADTAASENPAERESRMVQGAIRTDLILSAEILAIALGELANLPLLTTAAALAGVSIAVTVLVYGGVAIIVKMDDVGLRLAAFENRPSQAIGRGLVAAMPKLLSALSAIGIAAMAWVGGGILLHGMLETAILPGLPQAFHHWAQAVAALAPVLPTAIEWVANAVLAGLFGLALGGFIAGLGGLAARLRARH